MNKYLVFQKKLQVSYLQLLVLLLIHSSLVAQDNYSLKFMDNQKKETIRNVVVFANGQYVGASDKDGCISFYSSKKKVECYAASSGYVGKYFELGANVKLQVVLMNSYTLNEVIIESKRLDPIREWKESINYNSKYFHPMLDTVFYEFKKELSINGKEEKVRGTIMAVRPVYNSSKMLKSYYISQFVESDSLQLESSFSDSLPYIELSRLFSHDPLLKRNRKHTFHFFQENKNDVFFSKDYDSLNREIVCSGVNDFYSIDIHYLFSRMDTSILSIREKVFINSEIDWRSDIEIVFDEFYFSYSIKNLKVLVKATETIVYRLNGKDIMIKMSLNQIDRPDYQDSDIKYIFQFPKESKINKVYFFYY